MTVESTFENPPVDNLVPGGTEAAAALAAAIHDLRQPLQTISLLQCRLASLASGPEVLKHIDALAHPLAIIRDTLDQLSAAAAREEPEPPRAVPQQAGAAGRILLIEDDPAVAETLELILEDEGFAVMPAADGWNALEIVKQSGVPDLVIADYNLPGRLNGLQTIITLREAYRRTLPGLILTGGILGATVREIDETGCLCLAKPARSAELAAAVRKLIGGAGHAEPEDVSPREKNCPAVYVVDDDPALREHLRAFLEGEGFRVETFSSGPAFFETFRPGFQGCVLVDALMPGMDGFEFIERLKAPGSSIPAIMLTGAGDVPTAVKAMKAGAADFIEKPAEPAVLIASIRMALEGGAGAAPPQPWSENGQTALTSRQQEIMPLMLDGLPNKVIAARLGLSQRTVENHRAAIMRKFGVNSLAALIRVVLATSR